MAVSNPRSRLINAADKREVANTVLPFKATLAQHNLELVRAYTHTLQINLGLLCNQECRHCHLEAGPGRTENMDAATVDAVVGYAARNRFDTVDITGGAPELNPHVRRLIESIAPYTSRVMLRSNLSALNARFAELADVLPSRQVAIVASLPSINEVQTDSQRGLGVFQESIAVLKRLNALGYGIHNSSLVLNLVSNPAGAFLPPAQQQAEKRFHQVLADRWGVVFNNLFNFSNVPLGRFRQWLLKSGNFDKYMLKLSSGFNPCAVDGLMCRSLVSVGWDGVLYDCDFNLARGIPMGGHKIHIAEMRTHPEPGAPIATADHCYTCTAGSGFT
jgi:radical SAM/Cys-rich protein